MTQYLTGCAGDWVEVRSKEEILGTLDREGNLAGMPFMPEMLQFCGKRFRISKRAHKTCDTVTKTGGRSVEETVHLGDLRCDGSAHDGCQASCLLFWKEAWLKPVAGPNAPATVTPAPPPQPAVGVTEAQLHAQTRIHSEKDGAAGPTYRCQTTRLPEFTQLLHWWDVRQYVEDYRSGNERLPRMLRVFAFAVYFHVIRLGIGLGKPLKWLHDAFPGLFGGNPYPHRVGFIPAGQRTPTVDLGLQAGDWVRVKSFEEIRKTIDTQGRNRGLRFDREQVPYCGKTFRILKRVDHLIDEKSAKMLKLKGVSVLLEGAVCPSRYSNKRLLCPRALYGMWKEIWLERIPSPDLAGGPRPPSAP